MQSSRPGLLIPPLFWGVFFLLCREVPVIGPQYGRSRTVSEVIKVYFYRQESILQSKFTVQTELDRVAMVI